MPKEKFKKIATFILVPAIFLLVGSTVYLNLAEQRAVDRSKLPEKVEMSKGFQKWITNLKNEDFDIEADEFRLVEENEIYNTKWMKIYSMDEPGVPEELDRVLLSARNQEHVVYSPSDRHFVDYRPESRDGYLQNEVRFYGQKEDKVIDARILDCSIRANCYFDRAYFLDNDVFVISEISRNIDKKDEISPPCDNTMDCEYTFKIHLIDLINNKRWVYESNPFMLILDEKIKEL